MTRDYSGHAVIGPDGEELRYITRVDRTWCWQYMLVVEDDRTVDGVHINHYDELDPCPGPHREMWAAK